MSICAAAVLYPHWVSSDSVQPVLVTMSGDRSEQTVHSTQEELNMK